MNKKLFIKPDSVGFWYVSGKKGKLSDFEYRAAKGTETAIECGEIIEEIEPGLFYWARGDVTFMAYGGWSTKYCEELPIDYIKILKQTVFGVHNP